jgi:hypothetical protein
MIRDILTRIGNAISEALSGQAEVEGIVHHIDPEQIVLIAMKP